MSEINLSTLSVGTLTDLLTGVRYDMRRARDASAASAAFSSFDELAAAHDAIVDEMKRRGMIVPDEPAKITLPEWFDPWSVEQHNAGRLNAREALACPACDERGGHDYSPDAQFVCHECGHEWTP